MDFTKTIIPLALMASDSIAHSVEGDRGGGSPGEQGAGGVQEKKGREAGSLQWREAGEKFKKASFCYLLLLTSSQRNEPKNVS